MRSKLTQRQYELAVIVECVRRERARSMAADGRHAQAMDGIIAKTLARLPAHVRDRQCLWAEEPTTENAPSGQ